MKKAFFSVFMAAIMLFTSMSAIVSYAEPVDPNVIEIEDEVVEKAVRTALNLPKTEDITRENTEPLYYLEVDGEASSLKGLERMINLNYIEVRNASIDDLSFFADCERANIQIALENNDGNADFIGNYKGNNLNVLLSGSGSTIEDAFEQYYALEPITVVDTMKNVNVIPKSELPHLEIRSYEGTISFENSDETIAVVKDQGYMLLNLELQGKIGNSTITYRMGDKVKTTELRVVGIEEPILSDDFTEELPKFVEKTSAVSYSGNLWKIWDEDDEFVWKEADYEKYVARKVYEDYKSGTYFGARTEIAALDQNYTLYYWGAESDATAFDDRVVIAENVKELTKDGYLDQDNVFHFWSMIDPVGGEPKSTITVGSVLAVKDNLLIMEDDSIYQYNNEKAGEPILDMIPEGTIYNDSSYRLDAEQNLWKKDYTSDEGYSLTFLESGVTSVAAEGERGYYVKDGACYFIPVMGGVEKSIDELIKSNNQMFFIQNNTLYHLNDTIYSEVITDYKDIKGFVDKCVLDGNGDLWLFEVGHFYGFGQKYQVLTSVAAISEDENGDVFAVRKDGTIWHLKEENHYVPVKLDVLKVPNPNPVPMKFDDIKEQDWFAKEVSFVYGKGIMTGMTPELFGPYENLSRAQFAVMLHRLENKPQVKSENPFPDVAADTWYTDAAVWASENGMITGYANGYFGPADNITREQMATILYRYAKAKGFDISEHISLTNFADYANVSPFAADAMGWTAGTGIITGKENGTLLSPREFATRAECAVIFMRYMAQFAE